MAAVAGREYAIEQALDKMEGEWRATDFDIVDYADSGTYIMKESEGIQQLLDDQIMTTQVFFFARLVSKPPGRKGGGGV